MPVNNKKETRGRKMQSHNFRVIPVYRQQIDMEKFSQAIIEMARNINK